MNWTQKDIEATGLKINGRPISPTREKGKSKYGNKKAGDFDSKKERDYYFTLKIREKAGEITAISRQVSFQLSVCRYIADFVWYDLKAKEWVICDVKSAITKKLPVYRIKFKLMKKELGITITEV